MAADSLCERYWPCADGLVSKMQGIGSKLHDCSFPGGFTH